MAVEWRRDGAAVVVTLTRGGNDVLWQTLRTRLYGIASIQQYDMLTRVRVLSLPEAYYALAHEQLLTVPSHVYASLRAVWDDFAASSRSFVSHYIVYQHFRQFGWFVRSGLNYGAPFVLYRGDADVYHSEFIVYVATSDDEATATAWHAVQARTRVAEDVKKTVVLCEVSVDDSPQDPERLRPHREIGGPVMETHGRYEIHGTSYALDAVLVRYWDPATVDEDRLSYAFAQQPMLLKQPRKTPKPSKKKTNEKRPRTSDVNR